VTQKIAQFFHNAIIIRLLAIGEDVTGHDIAEVRQAIFIAVRNVWRDCDAWVVRICWQRTTRMDARTTKIGAQLSRNRSRSKKASSQRGGEIETSQRTLLTSEATSSCTSSLFLSSAGRAYGRASIFGVPTSRSSAY